MGIGAGFYMHDVVVKKFTFAISSPDEFLLNSKSPIHFSNGSRYPLNKVVQEGGMTDTHNHLLQLCNPFPLLQQLKLRRLFQILQTP